jgi:hypothetical protein
MRQLSFLLIIVYQLGFSQQTQLSPNAPPDKPVRVDSVGIIKLEKAIRPYIERAKKTYPDAKSRFQKGLPVGDIFFITTHLVDSQGRKEYVFVRVASMVGDTVQGQLASIINTVEGYQNGQKIVLPESNVIDWLIAKPDGSEEGNVVGKFIDTYQP